MIRLVAFLAAVVVAFTVMALAVDIAVRLSPVLAAHARLFSIAGNLVTTIAILAVAWKTRREKSEDDPPLTPLRRRPLKPE